MILPTPEERAVELVGDGESATQVQLRRVVADIVQQEREACDSAVERARALMLGAADAADAQARTHNDRESAIHYDGRSGGLLDALRILDEHTGRGDGTRSPPGGSITGQPLADDELSSIERLHHGSMDGAVRDLIVTVRSRENALNIAMSDLRQRDETIAQLTTERDAWERLYRARVALCVDSQKDDWDAYEEAKCAAGNLGLEVPE